MTYIDETTASLRLLAHTYKMVRNRLERPCNAVPDQPINLKGRLAKQGFRPWPYEKEPEPVKIIPLVIETAPPTEPPAPPVERDWIFLDVLVERANLFPPSFLRYIKVEIARELNTTVAALDCSNRTAAFVHNRHTAIYLCKSMIPYISLPTLGRSFGKRDHSSIHHAVNKVAREIFLDADYCQEIAELQCKLEWALNRWRAGFDLP